MNKLEFIPIEGATSVDPRYLFEKHRNKDFLKSDISVSAKITNLEAWKNLTGIKTRSEISTETRSWIIVAQIPAARFEEIAGLPFVKSLQMTSSVYPANREKISS